MNEEVLKRTIEEYLEKIRQSGKKETSDLAGDVKLSHREIKGGLDRIEKRLDTANGYTAKHEQRLNSQDVLNAQTALSLQAISNSLMDIKNSEIKTLKETTEANAAYITETKAVINTFKYLFALNLAGIGSIFVKIFLIK